MNSSCYFWGYAGFLVENKREHYIEHQRARQFLKQLIEDLRLDPVLFEDRSRTIQSMQKGYDSLQYLLTGKSDVADKEVLKILLPWRLHLMFPQRLLHIIK